MGTFTQVVLVIISLILGIGVTYFGTSLLKGIDQQTKIICAIVISLFAYLALYFMSKSRG